MDKKSKYQIVIDAVDKFSKNFNKAKKGLSVLGNAAKGVAKIMGGLLVAVTAVTSAFIALGNKAFQALDDIGKTAGRTGFTAEKLQALRLAAVESGSTVEGLNKAIEKFSKNIGDVIVKGTGEAKYALDRMGVSLYDNTGALKSNDQLLDDISDGISRMSSEVEKNSALQGMFGRAGILLNQVFAEGSSRIAEWVSQAEKMGFVVDARSIAAVESFNDRLAELKFMFQGLIHQTFAALAPLLDNAITQFRDWATEMNGTENGIKTLGEAIATGLVEGVAISIEAVGELMQFFANLENTAPKVTNAFATGLAPALNKVVPGLGFLVKKETRDNVIEHARNTRDWAGESKKLADRLRKLNIEVGTNGTAAFNSYSGAIEQCFKPLDEIQQRFNDFRVAFDTAIQTSKGQLQDFSNLGKGVAKTLEDGLTQAFMNIGEGLDSLKDMFKNIIGMILEQLIRLHVAMPIAEGIGGMFKADGGSVTGGRPYIVGERGPELFVPGTTGTIVPNDQMGGGGVVVNQSISFSTGIVPTVKAEVIKMLPQIAEVTKAAVAESAMRGGSYRRALQGG